MKLYTIGHSNLNLEEFSDILNKYKIDMVIDIRSYPYSKYVPHFNTDYLCTHLNANMNIDYKDLGYVLGGKIAKYILSLNEVIIKKYYELLEMFIDKYKDKNLNIVFMCSEKDPFKCHRFSLIGKDMYYHFDINIDHILSSDVSISHKDLEQKLIDKYREYKELSIEDLYTKHLADLYRM